MGRLKHLVAECDRRGLVVDISLTRGDGPGSIPNFEAHARAVETLLGALREHRNWYLDLANERDIRDARHVPDAEVKSLRELARRLDPKRLVTASYGGHDLDEGYLREAMIELGLDFVAPHRPREPESPGQTETHTRACLATMKSIGKLAPLHYQEPFRRDYGSWQPTADDFLTDLRGAIAGGAAGWCFHNGANRAAAGEHPRRSFDLHDRPWNRKSRAAPPPSCDRTVKARLRAISSRDAPVHSTGTINIPKYTRIVHSAARCVAVRIAPSLFATVEERISRKARIAMNNRIAELTTTNGVLPTTRIIIKSLSKKKCYANRLTIK
jgi:hypothetical protein